MSNNNPAAGRPGTSQSPASSDDVQEPDILSNWQLLVWMFRFVSPVKLLLALACFWIVLGVGVEVLAVSQTGKVVTFIQHINLSESIPDLGFWKWLRSANDHAIELRWQVIILSALVVLMAVTRFLRETETMRLSMAMVFWIREAVYDKLQRVGFKFHDKISTGQLITRSLTDLQNVRAFIQNAVLVTLEIVLTVGSYIILLATRSWIIALLSLAPLPIWTWYILRFGKRVQPASEAVMEAEDKNVNLITENIAGVHVVKAFATEKQEIEKYNSHINSYIGRVLHRVRLFANFTPVIRTIATVSHLSLFLAVAILVIMGKLDAGDFLVLGAAMSQILSRLQMVATINEQYQSAIVSARRLYEVLHAPPTVPERDNAVNLPPGAGHTTFTNVTFGYDPEKPVLHDISFDAKPGNIVALMGPTGSGKSSLVSLISRFYDPQQGSITIDGVDLRDLKLDSLRRSVAYVFQETYLFSDTVGANISYGRPHVTGGQVEAVSRLAQAHDFISELPKGYQTILEERGAGLSGGQRQRLAIARALLSNPRVLVLDDATAAIDAETDDLIRRGLKHVLTGTTVFIVAHRISSVRHADLILVMDHGRIVQRGTHDQLVSEKGHYRDIVFAQTGDGGSDIQENSHMDRMRQPAAIPTPTVAELQNPAVEPNV